MEPGDRHFDEENPENMPSEGMEIVAAPPQDTDSEEEEEQETPAASSQPASAEPRELPKAKPAGRMPTTEDQKRKREESAPPAKKEPRMQHTRRAQSEPRSPRPSTLSDAFAEAREMSDAPTLAATLALRSPDADDTVMAPAFGKRDEEETPRAAATMTEATTHNAAAAPPLACFRPFSVLSPRSSAVCACFVW